VSDSLVLSQHASSSCTSCAPTHAVPGGPERPAAPAPGRSPVIGVVLNQLDLDKAEKYYGEYSGYYSYKGYKKYGYGKSKVYGQA
jgi:hypothetical protein